MRIETKFDINNLVRHKFDAFTKNSFVLLEVMQIDADSCYAGTQVFYFCRPIVAQKEFEGFRNEGKFEWRIQHGVETGKDLSLGWRKYREDELVEAEKDHVEIILNGKKNE